MNDASFFIYNKYKFTPFQQRALIAVFAKFFYAKKKSTTSFNIDVRDIITDIEPRMTFQDIQKETFALLHKTYEIDEKQRFLQISIFSSAEFIKGQGIIKFHLTPAFAPYLEALKKKYSLLTIRDVIGFQSIYAVKVYLMLLPHQRGNSFKISINDLKTNFNILNQYKDYNTFKNRVLLQAQKELHLTHLAFTFQEVKEGRKVEHFILKTQPIEHLKINRKQEELIRKLVKDLEVTPTQAKIIVSQFLPEEIHQIMFSIKARQRNGQIKSSLGAYTVGVFSRLA